MMQSVQMGSILQKRSTGLTEQQWITLLEELEKNNLYLVIESDNPCVTKSPIGGFIPVASKTDRFSLCSREDLKEKGLPEGHYIFNLKESPDKLVFNHDKS
ncbi:hypothetical protein [Ammoniphilus sp. CFH 90114]|uniref:hypothetical protein n=1 Tax=Ammoniphilus sp. CFH 90114 TaxID=2493665 RepID=UPI00100DE332|nr:hypothetical protein [Ammoniphilus sp. CFH 90114]RXT14949.1 hypothetical protein EIZ39_01705 [Ammoniphilus sp. CFH 90114]